MKDTLENCSWLSIIDNKPDCICVFQLPLDSNGLASLSISSIKTTVWSIVPCNEWY